MVLRWVTCRTLATVSQSEKDIYVGLGGLHEERYGHLLVLMDGDSRFVWLEETSSCCSEVAARVILKLCPSSRMFKAFTRNGRAHLEGNSMATISVRLEVAHSFGGENSSWADRRLKRIIREFLQAFRTILSERLPPESEWQLEIGRSSGSSTQRFRSGL